MLRTGIMADLFAMEFFRNAFIVGLLLSVIFGVFSFFVVTKKMAFLSVGIAHSAFGGIALGVLLGINPFLSAMGFCVIVAILIGRLAKNNKLSYDTGIGIFFAFTMGLGALFIALKDSYTFDYKGSLFGDIMAVSTNDIVYTIIILVLFVPFVIIFLKQILFVSFDSDVAEISGIKVDLLETAMMIFLAAITVVSIKIVGIILVSALVVLPASFGLLLSRDYRKVILWGVVFSLVVITGGLFLSSVVAVPSGALIVCIGTVVYFATMGVKRLVRR
jgi:zinc transport system permease protein